jgi:hypothetical protein
MKQLFLPLALLTSSFVYSADQKLESVESVIITDMTALEGAFSEGKTLRHFWKCDNRGTGTVEWELWLANEEGNKEYNEAMQSKDTTVKNRALAKTMHRFKFTVPKDSESDKSFSKMMSSLLASNN